MSQLVFVEGTIASGKSHFINQAGGHLEPVQNWGDGGSILRSYYDFIESPDTFDKSACKTLQRTILEHYPTPTPTEGVVTYIERSPITSVSVFAHVLLARGYIDMATYKELAELARDKLEEIIQPFSQIRSLVVPNPQEEVQLMRLTWRQQLGDDVLVRNQEYLKEINDRQQEIGDLTCALDMVSFKPMESYYCLADLLL